ncbi:MAG: molecular chaperone DnaK [Myxococcales bacterium]|jgi:molecular chaperone DnaK
MGKIIGIDLGTTNSCVAVLEPDGPRVITGKDGSATTPSTVAFVNGQPRFVGSTAMRQMLTNPEGTIWGVKRLFGRKYDEPALERWLRGLPYEVVRSDNGDAWIRVGPRELSPQEVSAIVLNKLREQAEEYLGEAVEEAVITVPAYFLENQRQAVLDAGEIAGLRVRAVLNEPTAAALAYGIDLREGQTIAVFDLGGGTFDITILRTGEGQIEVLATNGDAFLGGDDFDRRLVEHLLEVFRDQTGIVLSDDPMAIQRLVDAARTAKIELSTAMSTEVKLPFLMTTEDGPLHLETEITRGLLEELTSDLIDDLSEPCWSALDDAGLTAQELNGVLLVGGMTRMPAVRHKVSEIFGKTPRQGVNPDEIVAVGAALKGGIIGGALDDVMLLDVIPHSLGVRVVDDKMSIILPRNTSIPTHAHRTFSTSQDDQRYVDVEVYEGEQENALDNTLLGHFKLHDLPDGRKGEVYIRVEFDIDSDGLLHVRAIDRKTGRATGIEAKPSAGLSREQVESLKEAAAQSAE